MPDPISTGALGIINADRGADAQVGAARDASSTQLRMFQRARRDQMPYMQAGRGGLNALMALYGFQQNPITTGAGGRQSGGEWVRAADPAAMAQQYLQMDPSYQFRLREQQGVLENSAAARGGLLSGNALRGLAELGQNFASTEYGNVANRLSGLAGMGQGAAQNIGSMGMQAGQALANNALTAGQARASGYMGQYNAANNMSEQVMKLIGMAMGGGMGG